ncbi:MAG: hypothetical protein KDI36_04310, partial [Pseudomonadales bacterium]|nr:hypothetical protein [Pseudomonadales bacterium]
MKSVSHSLTMLVCGLLLVGCFKANARLLEVQERSVITFSSPVAQDYHLSTPDRHYIIRAPHRQFSVHLRDYLGPVDITVHNNAAPTPSENDISIHSEEKPAAMEFATLLGEYLVGEETSSTIAPGNRPATLAELAELAELATSSRADEIPDHQLITLLALCNQQRNFGCADLIARQLHSRSALGLQDYASTLLLYARVQHRQDRQDERIRLLEQLLQKIGGSQHLKHEYLTARSELCDALIFQGRNESLRCLQTLLPETTAFPDIHAMVLNNLGGYYTAVERQSDLAASYFLQAEQVYQSLNQPYGEALALYNRGTILKDNRQYQESVKALTSAYHLFREGDHLTEYARTTAALGGIYLALERYPLANQFLTEALNKLSGNTENRLSAAVKMMLGSISREAGDTEEAVAYHTDYVRYHREIIRSDSPWRVARGLLELAKDQSALGEPDQALTLLEEGELILESDHSPLHASILAERAGALLSKNLPEEAEASALAALEIFQREDHVMPEELRVWGKLQEIYIRQQAPQKALTT